MTTILILSLLVLLHELGHFLVAKLFGIHVLEFGIGLPPKAFRVFKHKETEYTFNWLLIGGFVRLAGEDQNPSLWEKINPLTRSHMFWAKPAWQRALVIVAGVAMNFLIGILMFGVVYSKLGVPVFEGEQTLVTAVSENSPAQLADINSGDIIVRVGETEIKNADQFISLVQDKKGQMISLYLARMDGNGITSDDARVVELIPRENPPEGEGALGIGLTTVPIVSYDKKPWYSAPFYGAIEGTKEAIGWSRAFIEILLHPAELIKNIGGPVAVVKVGQEAVGDGWITMLRFAGIISLNLAIFNLLPIPALDGGRLLMIVLEKIIGRKRVSQYEGYVNTVGMVLLISLLIGVTIKDLFFS